MFDGWWDEIKGIFQSRRDIFHLILIEIKANITKINSKTQNTTTNITFCSFLSEDSCVSLRHDAAGPAECPCATLVRVTL